MKMVSKMFKSNGISQVIVKNVLCFMKGNCKYYGKKYLVYKAMIFPKHKNMVTSV